MLDRLLGNPKLQAELLTWYRALATALLRGQRRVVVLVDWTQVADGLWALTASVPFRGRSLPILCRVFPKSKLGSRLVQQRFLGQLRQILPPPTQPVIVADGGFRTPFFHACAGYRLDFVIRLRNDRSSCGLFDEFDSCRLRREPFAALFSRAGKTAQCLGEGLPYAYSKHSSMWRLVLGPRPPKAARRRRYADDYERKRGCEPFLLATSLPNEAAASVVTIYEQRMQIEESFRDTKSARFGWALEHALTRCPRRLEALLLLAAIAFAAVVLIGAAADEAGLERTMRASSTRNRVLSLFTLGNLVVTSGKAPLSLHAVWKQVKGIRSSNRALFPYIPPPRSQNRSVKLPLPHDLFCVDCGWKGREYGWPA
jgi:hypothetical protein